MIKSTELRIGNLVFVVGIGEVNVSHLLNQDYPELDPIHLTEEYADKFELVKKDSTTWQIGRYDLVLNPIAEKWLLYIGGTPLAALTYVHEFQNLIFALTNIELTIKTK